MHNRQRENETWAAGAFVVIVGIVLIFLFGGGCPKKEPPPPPPPSKPIELPSAEDVGHRVGKVTGDGSKGFLKGLRESWFGKPDEPKKEETPPNPAPDKPPEPEKE